MAQTFIVAEISGNHLGSIERAIGLVQAAAWAGASAIKLQTYTADTMTVRSRNNNIRVTDTHPLWGGRSLYDLYTEAHTPWSWHAQLFDLAHELGMAAFSTPFDHSAVDFLESLNVELYKISSLEITDLPLIRKVAATGKPILMSTGAASLEEVDRAVREVEVSGANDLTLLLCTSSYPTSAEDLHLRRLDLLAKRYSLPVGLSDHSREGLAAVMALSLGATVVEKHLCLRRSDGGPDAEFSSEPEEFAALVRDLELAERMLGRSDWPDIPAEAESRRLRRSLYVLEDVQAGDVVCESNVAARRPTGGLEPKHWWKVMGRRFAHSVDAGVPLTWEMLTDD